MISLRAKWDEEFSIYANLCSSKQYSRKSCWYRFVTERSLALLYYTAEQKRSHSQSLCLEYNSDTVLGADLLLPIFEIEILAIV